MQAEKPSFGGSFQAVPPPCNKDLVKANARPIKRKDLTANRGMLGLDGLFIESFIGRMGNLIPTTTFFTLLYEGSAVIKLLAQSHGT